MAQRVSCLHRCCVRPCCLCAGPLASHGRTLFCEAKKISLHHIYWSTFLAVYTEMFSCGLKKLMNFMRKIQLFGQ